MRPARAARSGSRDSLPRMWNCSAVVAAAIAAAASSGKRDSPARACSVMATRRTSHADDASAAAVSAVLGVNRVGTKRRRVPLRHLVVSGRKLVEQRRAYGRRVIAGELVEQAGGTLTAHPVAAGAGRRGWGGHEGLTRFLVPGRRGGDDRGWAARRGNPAPPLPRRIFGRWPGGARQQGLDFGLPVPAVAASGPDAPEPALFGPPPDCPGVHAEQGRYLARGQQGLRGQD